MKVMVIVKATADSEAGVLPTPELLAAMGRFNEELADAGVLLAGEGLKPTSQGVRVQFDGAQRRVVDGPFAETKEQLLGFYIVDVETLEEGLQFARELTEANPGGAYELRPVGLYLPGSPFSSAGSPADAQG